jgi:hypothetical protein
MRPLPLAFTLALAGAASVSADDRTVALVVRDAGFEPGEVKGPRDSRFRLDVTNETSARIEFETFQLNRERAIKPGQRTSVYLSDLSPGRYEFFDDLHREHRGTLLIE